MRVGLDLVERVQVGEIVRERSKPESLGLDDPLGPLPTTTGTVSRMATQAETLEVGGRDDPRHQPGQGLLPRRPRWPDHEARPRRVLDRGRGRRARGCRDRPTTLHRFPDGAAGEGFYQKRLPKGAPPWVETALITFPSGRTANMPVMADAAHLAWAATLGCLEINPWPVRSDDVDHPDELRIDLDPMPEVPFDHVREVAIAAKDVLEEFGLVGLPEDQREEGHPRQRSDPPRVGLHRGSTCCARPRSRGGAPSPRHRVDEVVEGGAPRRVPRLQPERSRSDGGLRVQRPADAGRAGVDAADVGRGRGRRARGVHAQDGARPAPDRGRSRRGDRRPCRHARARPRALGPAGARGPGGGARIRHTSRRPRANLSARNRRDVGKASTGRSRPRKAPFPRPRRARRPDRRGGAERGCR